jgi:hypothetical protein
MARFLAQTAGLIATGWLLWIVSLNARVHRFTWGSVLAEALGSALLAWIWSAAITFLLYLALPARERRDVLWVSLRTASAAVWFAPAIILLTNFSPAALAAALVLVITATRLLYGEWRLGHPSEWMPAIPPGMFGENLPPPPLVRDQFAPALWIGLLLQSGMAAALLRLPLLAAALAATAAALVTIYAMSTGAVESQKPRKLPEAVFGLILTLLLASGLTVGGLGGRVLRGHANGAAPGAQGDPSAGLIESARSMLRSLMYGETPPAVSEEKRRPEVPDLGPFPAGSFPGVILTSEVRPVPLLVAPVTADRALSGAQAQPFAIPFDGEYWMYRYLFRRPPLNSYHRQGSPANLSFSTTDRWPLMMEAHQKLDQAIDFRCCRAVRIEIRNADPDPETLSLELTLLDSESGASRSTFLGSAPVLSAPDRTKTPVAAVPESLDFAVPQDVIENCNEFKLVFRRIRHPERSARVAIDRFVLLPR